MAHKIVSDPQRCCRAGIAAALVFSVFVVASAAMPTIAAARPSTSTDADVSEFFFHASGFPDLGLADTRGRMLWAPIGARLGDYWRIDGRHWMVADEEARTLTVFDHNGRILRTRKLRDNEDLESVADRMGVPARSVIAREPESGPPSDRVRLGERVDDAGVRYAVHQSCQRHQIHYGMHGAPAGRMWIADPRGKRLRQFDGGGFQPAAYDGPLLRYEDEDGRRQRRGSILDCAGAVLFEDDTLRDLETGDAGYLARLSGERDQRVWISPGLQKHVLPPGSRIDKIAPDGTALVVAMEGHKRLYNPQRQALVGAAFDWAEQPQGRWVIFNRGGFMGLMDIDGAELQPPRYYEITPWGSDRYWTRSLGSAEGPGMLRLHDAQGQVLYAREETSLSLRVDSVRPRAVAHAVVATYRLRDGAYLVQQWIDRNGEVILEALQCPGEDPAAVLASGGGVLTGPGWDKPLHHGGRCEMPEPIRVERECLARALDEGNAWPSCRVSDRAT